MVQHQVQNSPSSLNEQKLSIFSIFSSISNLITYLTKRTNGNVNQKEQHFQKYINNYDLSWILKDTTSELDPPRCPTLNPRMNMKYVKITQLLICLTQLPQLAINSPQLSDLKMLNSITILPTAYRQQFSNSKVSNIKINVPQQLNSSNQNAHQSPPIPNLITTTKNSIDKKKPGNNLNANHQFFTTNNKFTNKIYKIQKIKKSPFNIPNSLKPNNIYVSKAKKQPKPNTATNFQSKYEEKAIHYQIHEKILNIINRIDDFAQKNSASPTIITLPLYQTTSTPFNFKLKILALIILLFTFYQWFKTTTKSSLCREPNTSPNIYNPKHNKINKRQRPTTSPLNNNSCQPLPTNAKTQQHTTIKYPTLHSCNPTDYLLNHRKIHNLIKLMQFCRRHRQFNPYKLYQEHLTKFITERPLQDPIPQTKTANYAYLLTHCVYTFACKLTNSMLSFFYYCHSPKIATTTINKEPSCSTESLLHQQRSLPNLTLGSWHCSNKHSKK